MSSSTAQKAPANDRRRSERKAYIIEASLCSPTAKNKKKERIEATSVNINRHGIAFQMDKALPIDSFYVVEVMLGEREVISEIRIISCRKAENGNYEIGAEFC